MRNNMLVQVNELTIGFTVDEKYIEAVDSVSFTLKKGESLGLVGESGCGKTVTAMSILKLLPIPPAHIKSGKILFNGKDIFKLSKEDLYTVRGKDIGVIFQEPMTSLNPVKKIGFQIEEPLKINFPDMSREEIYSKSIAILKEVGLPEPEKAYILYPHNLSGGMRQRVVIAIAMITKPKLLIADEPTTALDVTIQAQIMELIKSLQKQYAMSLLLITHNMGLITHTCDRVIVMYAGRFAEIATVKELFQNPLHPYTKGLLQSIPGLDSKQGELESIPGTVPHPSQFLKGCRFAPRCPKKFEKCDQETPPSLFERRKDHRVSCWLYDI